MSKPRKDLNVFTNGMSIRTKNKRITVYKLDDRIGVSMQAILPKEELNFDGCGIRGNFKQTRLGLTIDAAEQLCYLLYAMLEKNKANTLTEEGK